VIRQFDEFGHRVVLEDEGKLVRGRAPTTNGRRYIEEHLGKNHIFSLNYEKSCVRCHNHISETIFKMKNTSRKLIKHNATFLS
jgi:hypothetical protein